MNERTITIEVKGRTMNERTITIEVDVSCNLSEEYFAEWGLLPQDLKEFWERDENYCNCNGTGTMGTWCHDCPFGDLEEKD